MAQEPVHGGVPTGPDVVSDSLRIVRLIARQKVMNHFYVYFHAIDYNIWPVLINTRELLVIS